MKKLLACFIIMLMLGGVLGFAMQSIKEDVPVIGAVIDIISPSAAYADGGGDGGGKGPAPPPPPSR